MEGSEGTEDQYHPARDPYNPVRIASPLALTLTLPVFPQREAPAQAELRPTSVFDSA
jgi:hypothetical protein